MLVSVEKDFDFFNKHQELYMSILNGLSKLTDDYFKEFMGEEFSKKPLPMKKEIEKDIQYLIEKNNRFNELKAPSDINSCLQTNLENKVQEYKEGKYILTVKDAEYRIEYDKKQAEFQDWLDYNIEYHIERETILEKIPEEFLDEDYEK
jgi:hypothetical protein